MNLWNIENDRKIAEKIGEYTYKITYAKKVRVYYYMEN